MIVWKLSLSSLVYDFKKESRLWCLAMFGFWLLCCSLSDTLLLGVPPTRGVLLADRMGVSNVAGLLPKTGIVKNY